MSGLTLEKLSACGEDRRGAVLHEVDLTVADGEVLTVVGPSGSGKSTLLRALVGLADVPQGRLLLDGEEATDWAPAERDMAMVFQDHAPYPHLRVRDNLALPLRLAGLPGAEIAGRVREVADRLGLGVHLDRWPRQLSGGQRQRVALGRVLVRAAPAAYLLDEPLSADPAVHAGLRAMIAGTTTVWATPDPAEAVAVGDRIAVLRDGRLAQVGTARELAERPSTLWVAAMAPLNVLRGTIGDGQLRLPMASLPLAGRPPGDVLVGIRPADLTEPDTDSGSDAGPGADSGSGSGSGGVRVPMLVAAGVGPDGTATLRHPALARAAEEDPALSPTLRARVDPGGRRSVPVLLDPARMLLFDPETGAAL
ncbi:MAG TPA: ABC transporter ATP-binding protein [Mycobacteriales bacterium]|nr:ABC transporter ATP-binding protein [Mycobacteriales bacterium]